MPSREAHVFRNYVLELRIMTSAYQVISFQVDLHFDQLTTNAILPANKQLNLQTLVSQAYLLKFLKNWVSKG